MYVSRLVGAPDLFFVPSVVNVVFMILESETSGSIPIYWFIWLGSQIPNVNLKEKWRFRSNTISKAKCTRSVGHDDFIRLRDGLGTLILYNFS